MSELPDWMRRREHIETRSARSGGADTDILVEWANEAYEDPMAVDFVPDYASKSG